MDKIQTFQLYRKGRDEWNRWADQQLLSKNDSADWKQAARCDFSDYEFKEEVDFSEYTFPGDTRFRSSRFRKTAWFRNTKFRGDTTFFEAAFGGVVNFRGATFGSDFSMAGATFEKALTLQGARFEGRSDFRSAEGSVAIFMEGATFGFLPDFHGAAFRTPRLDNVTLEDPFIRRLVSPPGKHDPRPWYLRRMKIAVDADVHAKYRVLKKMAIDGHDRDRELEFAAQEVKGRRFWKDEPNRWESILRFWLGFIYDKASNFGRSVWRPLIALILLTLGFALFYWSQQAPWASSISREKTTAQRELARSTYHSKALCFFSQENAVRKREGRIFACTESSKASPTFLPVYS